MACSWTLKTLLACSCSPLASAPTCQLIGITPVVFLGTVSAAEPDPAMPLALAARVYRFRVDRAYKGLSKDKTDVVINPENSTSCARHYQVGKQYLMFAVPLQAGNPHSEIYQSGGCSGSRRAEEAVRDIQFLDEFALGKSSTRIYGKTLQWVTSSGHPREDEQAPAGGARVKLQSENNSWETVSGPDGVYSFDGLNPGSYVIGASLDHFAARRESQPVQVSSGGCVEQLIELKSHTELSGVVLNGEGHPADHIRIELLHKNLSGKWYNTYQFWTRSDKTGRFQFEDIPTGEYLLGYEIQGGAPSIDSAVPTTYYPGVSDKGEATILHLGPNQKLGDLKFRLKPPHTPRRITVKIMWPDGTPPGNHLLQIIANDQLVKNIGGLLFAPIAASRKPFVAGEPSTVTFTGYQERQYRISARYWVDDLGGPVPHDQRRLATTDVALIEPGTGPSAVRLVLGRPKLAEE
jgi:Carboxypeptidase regulatory-like domain/Polysaccharide lyase family 4, domain II